MARIRVNRAPVLTLWAAVVAERLGFDEEEALTLGRALAGLNAQAKGQRLGIFQPGKEKAEPGAERRRGEELSVALLGRMVPATNTPAGVRAASGGKSVDPESVRRYLAGKFGEDLPEVRRAMQELALAYSPQELATMAYALYERFRPVIPAGEKGWGAKGELDLDFLRALAAREG
ncbi:MAG: hypothetical protein QME94_03955 [Anaerolineae bacterium]|nr:hypothetical protein [Anaerolineae bacterium]